MNVKQQLESVGACVKAVQWASKFPSLLKAWRECQRGDWMLWLLGRTIDCGPWTDGRKPLLECALDCAETVKHLWPAEQIAADILALRQWIKGTATVEQAQTAKKSLWGTATAAAPATADAADANAAADAADAAAYAADAADAADAAAFYAAADTANAAAYAAADTAYAAANAAAAYAARSKTLAKCASIVRRHYPKPPKIKEQK